MRRVILAFLLIFVDVFVSEKRLDVLPEIRISLVEGIVSPTHNVIDLLSLALLCQHVKLVSHRVWSQGISRSRYKHDWHLYLPNPLIIWPFDASYSRKQST